MQAHSLPALSSVADSARYSPGPSARQASLMLCGPMQRRSTGCERRWGAPTAAATRAICCAATAKPCRAASTAATGPLATTWRGRGSRCGTHQSWVSDALCEFWCLSRSPHTVGIAQFFAIGPSVAIGVQSANVLVPNSGVALMEVESKVIARAASCLVHVTDSSNHSAIAIRDVATIRTGVSEAWIGMGAHQTDSQRHRSLHGKHNVQNTQRDSGSTVFQISEILSNLNCNGFHVGGLGYCVRYFSTCTVSK